LVNCGTFKKIMISKDEAHKIIKDYRDNKFSKYTGVIAEIIKHGQKTGVYRPDIKPDLAKRVFFGALDEISRVWNASLETNYTVEEIANETLSIFLSGIERDSANTPE